MSPEEPVVLYEPSASDLWFKQAMLADPATMAYNHASGGTIPFPKEKWQIWHQKWISGRDPRFFYRYLLAGGTFVGEIAWHYVAEEGMYIADVIVSASHRNRGYGTQGLRLLCQAAKEAGIDVLYDVLAIDNPSLSLFLKNGFEETRRDDTSVTVRIRL